MIVVARASVRISLHSLKERAAFRVNLADKIVMRPIDALIPYARNARQHSLVMRGWASWYRVDQPVGHQRLQHVQPTRSLSRGRQSWRPEVIQPQLIPQMAGQPAGAPLSRPVQPQSAEPDMHHIAIQNWRRAVLGEQR